MARIASAVLVAVALAGCSGGEEAGLERADLPRVVLQPEDLGAPFTQFDEGPLRAADRPSGERADPARFGRVDGRIARYRRRGSPTTEGPLVVESRVDLFESGDGASSDLHAAREQSSPSRGGAADVAGADLGDEAHLTEPGQATPGAVRYFTVVWRYQNVLATLTASGFRLEAEDVLALARKQQARMERAAS
jgi:hypothetical protein